VAAAALPRVLAPGSGDLASHLDHWGRRPVGGAWLIGEVERAGLRGRGGGGFPTHIKMQAVASRGRDSVVVANGAEREPVSCKDKTLMATHPHLVLDGLSLAAESVGATRAVICADRGATSALDALERALADRQRLGTDRVPIRLEASPSAYVTGEETALVQWLNGGPAKPTFVPPRPFEKGVGGQPTLVNNVETLAHMALVARFGADWFRAVGTVDDPGSALVTVNGSVAVERVFEIPYGYPLQSIAAAASPTAAPTAVLVGGYGGAWCSWEMAERLTFDRRSLRTGGSVVGCGSISVIGANTCGLVETLRVVKWMAGHSAGQCGPCVRGLPALAGAFGDLVAGRGGDAALRRVRNLTSVIADRGACHHPDGVLRLVSSAVSVFAEELARHRRNGVCRPSAPVLPLGPAEPGWR
jgi:NADH:ubiquinone oxidoreductase subunit F (NADH-binding)